MPESKEPALERPAPENAKPPILTFRILFLDSAENVEVLKATCKEDGYVVVGATTIEDALAFLHGKDHADVIVAAAYLEDESVFQFLREVRDSEQHREVMFLILSLDPSAKAVLLDRSTERAAMLLGANGYLIMPSYDPGQLIAEIKKLQPAVPMLQQCATPEEKKRSE